MAVIHQATLSPSKLDLLSAWVPARPWSGGAADLRQLGAYRFDDPAGEVGIETLLVRAGDGRVLQVPLTYRGAPLAGADRHLVGTLEHSVLGRRWVYDGCGDPVWAAAVAAAVLTGGTQADEVVQTPDGPVPRRPSATVRGSGTPGTPVPPVTALPEVREPTDGETTVAGAGDLEVHLVRVVGARVPAGPALTGRWDGGDPVVLAALR